MGTLLETDDLDVARDTLFSAYRGLRITATGDQHRLALGRVSLGPLTLERLSVTMHFTGDGPPLRRIGFAHLRRGVITHRQQRTGFRHNIAGDTYLVVEPDEPFHITVADADVIGAFVDAALLAEVAGAERPPRFTRFDPASPQAAEMFARTMTYVTKVAGSEVAQEPLVAGTTARMLAATALAAIPNDAVHEPTAQDRRDAHEAALRRAVGYADDHAHTDIGEADLAMAAGISVRSLRLAFARQLGSTPNAYLRRVRLQHAHLELLTADPATTTPASVAARWGFADEGRFAAEYHAAYGVPPSVTLRRD